MRRLLLAAGWWFGSLSGAPPISVMQERAFELNSDWEIAHTNDEVALDDDPFRDRIAAAGARFEVDEAAGLGLYLRLAEQGSAFCMGRVGWCYYTGCGVPINRAKATDWYRRGFEAGCMSDLLIYGKLLIDRGDFAGAEAVFRNGAADGWAPAEVWLAWIWLGRGRTSQSLRKARLLLEQAAAKGSPAAHWMLAYHRAIGRFGFGEITAGLRALIALGDQCPAAARAAA